MTENTDSTTITEQMDGKDKKKIKTINDLNDDSLLIIFSLLSVRDKTRCERVCQRWNDLIKHSWASNKLLAFVNSFNVWRQAGHEDLDTLTLTKIISKCPNLTTLNFEQTATNFDETVLDVIGQFCPKLEKLIMKHKNLSGYNIANLGRACPMLKSIDFSRCNDVSETSLCELLLLRPDMESISLSRVDNITGKCFYRLNSLSYLDLSGCSSIVTDAFSLLGQNCSQTLKTLLAPSLSNAGLKIICTTFLNLEVFEVESSIEVELRGARLLGNLKKLRVLRFYPELEDLDNGAMLSIMEKCLELTELSLCGTEKLTDLSIANLPEYLPNLTKLTLEGSQISDKSARALADLKKLTELKINGSLITDEGAMHLITHCRSLEHLSVNQCPGVTLETVLYAWDLVHQGLASKELVIVYKGTRIVPSFFPTREKCGKYDESDEEEEYCHTADNEENLDDLQDYEEDIYDHDYEPYGDDEEYDEREVYYLS
ncbi:dynein regulatory complex subunit 6 isoform X2 [Tetranychus urticae]|uniref:F-box domain-containing protein n=1 Tax=Tetranychus urticae TaxID=32264 RepID=T1K640_TETUR|nr:dynein regulatory complex subunit 6 isoform X2 [Tetranychus urticae]